MNTKQHIESFILSTKTLLRGDSLKINHLSKELKEKEVYNYLWIMIVGYVIAILFKYALNYIMMPSVSCNILYKILTKPATIFLVPWSTAWIISKISEKTKTNVQNETLFADLLLAYIPLWFLEVTTILVPWLYLIWIVSPYAIYILYQLFLSEEQIPKEKKNRYTIGAVLLYLCIHICMSLLFNMINLL
ncbi:MAG: hypothetical protein N4A37_08845 [Prolixibacteraceae bacterium]|jgi:hypothetical protein|nr:hypothetical protein [Prolixibacteraceae bacterium]